MNQKELNEIRRRIRLDRSSISHIYGCYVNSSREIISTIDESMGLLSQELLSAVVIMIIGCAVATPIMLKLSFRNAPEARLVHSELAEQMDKVEQLDIVAESLLRQDRELKKQAPRDQKK